MTSELVAVVVAGGDSVDARALVGIPDGAFVIAADSGADHALALGLHVDVAIGDFDSITAEGLAAVTAAGAEVISLPPDKDATDLQLALDEAVSRGATTVVVLGGHGGRLDHLLANATLLAAPKYDGVAITARWGDAGIVVIRPGTTAVAGEVGETISLIPVHSTAVGVRTDGLQYPLDGEDLSPGTSRGVSNVFVAPIAHVSLERGVLVAVLPNEGNRP